MIFLSSDIHIKLDEQRYKYYFIFASEKVSNGFAQLKKTSFQVITYRIVLFLASMFLLRIILLPFSLIYGGILTVRNWLFDSRLKPVTKMNAKVISVGNLSVGGTGKTPHVEYLVQFLKEKFNTAILLRGYGRKTKGFYTVAADSTVSQVGDEALNYAKTFEGKVQVAVCEKRVEGARDLLDLFPSIEVVVLDDAYQHRYIHRDCNILLTEYNRPYFKDFVLPTGNLREFSCGKKRADIVIVTKSPKDLTETQKQAFEKRLKVKKDTPVFFSEIAYGDLVSLQGSVTIQSAPKIVLVTGIGNSTPLLNHLQEQSEVIHVEFRDHYDFALTDIEKIHKIFDNFVGQDKVIVTTEKDAMRLLNSELSKSIKSYPWYWQSITVKIDKENEFLNKVYGSIISN